MDRPKITGKELDNAIRDMQIWLYKRLEEKGDGAFSSTHELRGSIDEEVTELFEAMHIKDCKAIEHELKDVLVSCIFGLACLQSKKMEW